MNTYYYGLLMSIMLLGGCQDKTPPPATGAVLPPDRAVATVYHVSAASGNTPCYRAADASSPIVTLLHEKQLVDLVSLEAGMVQTGQDYWLHVYPRIGHRPTCYINVRNLVPDS